MGWTDSETVKKHLFDLDQRFTEFTDASVRIEGNGMGSLPHRGIVASSDTVKRIMQLEPTSQSGVILNGETWRQLSCDNLVPEQIVVCIDEGMGTIYHLDQDYAFNPAEGKIRRIEGGNIPDGGSVQTYFRRYEIMNSSTDYTLDNEAGTLTIKSGGNLVAESTVWVDYQVSVASGADQLISEAIIEAENKILSRLKDEYDGNSQDQGLKTGATELTLAIICRSLVSQALADGCTAAEARARGWRELSETFSRSAWITLAPFLAVPVIRHGDKRSNQSWEWA